VLQQVDTPKELYDNPVNLFVAGFIGSPAMNFFAATVEGDRLKLPFAEVSLSGPLREAVPSGGGELIAGVRPEHFYDPAIESGASGCTFEVPIELVESMGSEVYAHFSIGSGGPQSDELAELAADSGAADVPSAGEGIAVARLDPTTRARTGERMQLGMHPESIHLFDPRSGRNLALGGSGDGRGTNAEIGIAPVTPTPEQGDQPPSGEEPTTRLS
jgi:multiple sugar transport system ATP-binding protein